MAVKNDATVLAFEKKLIPSDGFLYGTIWENRSQNDLATPLALTDKSVRGTISNRLKKSVQDDPEKLNNEAEKPNLQRVDTCALGEFQDTVKLSFSLKVVGGIDTPSASNGREFNRSYPKMAQTYIEQEGFKELAKRYATNIANARYLWRNRVGAKKIEVIVKIGDDTLVFDAKQIPLNRFNTDNQDLRKLADIIAEALSGKSPYLLLEIDAYALIGKAQEVYPSEELVLGKGASDKSKILYEVSKVAAMHSQKIGNALRTIDTWYPGHDDVDTGIGPIAIEPYGAVTNIGKAFRTPRDGSDFYTLFDRFAMGERLADKNDEHYVMAVLVRGGVFGQTSKE